VSGLRLRDGESEPRCAECEKAQPIGPCAACHSMICGDCGVMSKDPGGRAVICLSCANLVAAVRRRAPQRRKPSAKITALLVLLVLGLGTLLALTR
jgi:hypothetical protein